MNTFEKQAEELVNKARSSDKSDDAMRYSQAAVNVANAAQTIAHIKIHLSDKH